MRIVVIAPSATGVADDIAALASRAQIAVLSEVQVNGEIDAETVILPRGGPSARFSDFLSRTTAGRALRRVGPWDPGAMFARRAKRSEAARKVLDSADLIVAAERDACFTAWTWSRLLQRRGVTVAAVQGFAAAREWARRHSAVDV